MDLIDSHAHLDSVGDIEGALRRAREAGVRAIVAVGEDKESNRKNLTLKEQCADPRILLGLGLHPGQLGDLSVDQELQYICSHIHEADAVGEIGLDFWYKWVRKDAEKKAEQRRVYRELLVLAREHDLPALIHTRGTWQEAVETAREVGVQKAVFHWYSGPLKVLEEILEAGYYISASLSVAYSEEVRRALQAAPLERILLETDTPVFYRQYDGGLKAEPRDVAKTLRHLSCLKGLPEEDVVRAVNTNLLRLFPGLAGMNMFS
ncbi:MAG: TatD family hydrolase [Candidatus Omnitrophota bacterium]